MKVLVTGINGQLGYDICKELENRKIEYLGTTRNELDLCDEQSIKSCIISYKPDVMVHCAAYTAVDKAEDEPELAYKVNAQGTRYIAKACKEIGAKLIYISTDYVFHGDGEQFYEVDDEVNPLGVYGKTKLEGEIAVREMLDRYFIVRISWVFGKNGSNFVKTMLRLSETRDELSVVCDQIGSPTYTKDLAPLLCDMAESDKYGIYHATNDGVCSWADFAKEIFALTGKDIKVNSIPSIQYPTRAKRPLNSRMSKKILKDAGFKGLPHWKDALLRYLNEIR